MGHFEAQVIINPVMLVFSMILIIGQDVRIVKYATARNLVIGMQTGRKCHSRSNDDMSLINNYEEDLALETDTDGDIL